MRLLMLLLMFLTAATAQAECRPGRVLLQVLGSGGPELDDGRASSAYLLWLDGRARLLIDAGAGAALNFERSGARIEDLQAVLFTHLHVDHSVAFPAFIKAAFFTSRESELPVFGPDGNALMPATTEFVQDLLGPNGAYRYLSEYVTPGEPAAFHVRGVDVPLRQGSIWRSDLGEGLNISAIPVHHGPIAALGWRVDIAGCSLSFSGDTSNRYQAMARLAAGSDLLIAHNAVPEGAAGVARNLHMPPGEIGRIADRAAVGAVLMSHRMNRTSGAEQQGLSQAGVRRYYGGPVRFADDMACYDPASGSRVAGSACPARSVQGN